MSSPDNSNCENPEEMVKTANMGSLDLLSAKSRDRYESMYKEFEMWCQSSKVEVINEDVILAYMLEKSKTLKPTSLWSRYSMLRATVLLNKNIDIKFPKVMAFLKKQAVGHKAKKAKAFERQDIDKFLEEAPDANYLMMKVMVIIGLAGACRREELCKLTVDDIEDKNELLIVTIPDAKTRVKRKFIVLGENNIALYKKYRALRPRHVLHRRLFVFYRSGQCTVQPVGVQTLGKIPRRVAAFLNLANPEQYTGHSFRKSSAACEWKATSVTEGCITDSIQSKIEIAKRIQMGAMFDQDINAGTSKMMLVTKEGNTKVELPKLGSWGKTKWKDVREYYRKTSSNSHESDKEDRAFQPHLAPSTSVNFKSRDDERESLFTDESRDGWSPGSDPLELELPQPSKPVCFSPSTSAGVYSTSHQSRLSSSKNFFNQLETDENETETSNPSYLPGVVNDAYTKFFQSMADTVRDLPPDLQIVAKRNVLHAVTECELTALNRLNGSKS